MFNLFKSKPAIEAVKEEELYVKDEGFDALLLKIRSICGIDLEVKRSTIKTKLIKFCKLNQIDSFSLLNSKIELNAQLRQELFDLITVCETYFYRELKQLQELIFLLKSQSHLRRILCAPCSSGEEVYSILMLASLAGLNNLQITGIDINEQIIQKALNGVYSKRSLYTLDESLINRFFKAENDEYKIKKELLAPAQFKVVNVFGKEFGALGKFDVILSRNMMIYFNEEYKYKLIDIFYKQLNNNGLLFTGHADLVPAHNGFKKVFASSCSYYQRD